MNTVEQTRREQVERGPDWYRARALERRRIKHERRTAIYNAAARDIAELEKQFSYLGLKK